MASTSAGRGRGNSRRDVLQCKNHPDASLIEDYHAGDMICSLCGLVVGDRVIDVGSEWRTFSNDKNSKDMSRVGAAENSLLEGGDLTTMIQTSGGYGGDDSGYKNRKNVSSSDRNLMNAFREMSQMADRLNLPSNIVERGNRLFKQIHDSKALKGGASNDAIASACVYISCRQEGVPRTFKEICAVSKVSKKEIGRTFKKIIRTQETSLELITTGDFMSRFCSNLNLPNSVQRAATYIAKRAAELDLCSGRSPISVAAAAIYMASQASDQKKTQKEIGDIAGVAEVTITKSYKKMRPSVGDLFPPDFDFKTPIDALPKQ